MGERGWVDRCTGKQLGKSILATSSRQTWGLTHTGWDHWGRNSSVITSRMTDAFPASSRKPAVSSWECVCESKELGCTFHTLKAGLCFKFYTSFQCKQLLSVCLNVCTCRWARIITLYVEISSAGCVVWVGPDLPWVLLECGKQDFSSSSLPVLQTPLLLKNIQCPDINYAM